MQLPHVISAARGWFALFPCDLNPVRAMIAPPLEPVTTRKERAVVGVWLIDCEESDWGAYRHLVVGVASRVKSWMAPPLGGLWFGQRASDFGFWVHLSLVSSDEVAKACARYWSLPSVAANIDVTLKRSKVRAVVAEGQADVLELEMKRPGAGMPQRFPWRYYARQGDEVVRADMFIDAVGSEKSLLASAKLNLLRHETVEPMRTWFIRTGSPISVRWYDSLRLRIEEPCARFRIT